MITTDALPATQRERVRELLGAVARHDGVAAVDEAGMLALEGTDAHHVVVEMADGVDDGPGDDGPGDAVIGYAGILADGTTQGAVHPAHRHRGVGGELLRSALARRPDLAVWAHGALPGALAFLERQGLTEVRRLLLLGRALDTPPLRPAPAVPDGLRLGTFVLERDAEDWLRLNAAAFASHPEQGRMTRADLDRRMAEPWFDPEDLMLLRDADGDLQGSLWIKQVGSGAAEIYVVAISPSAQGRGLGTVLLGAALHRLADAGAQRVELYVEGDNDAALALYGRWGFRTVQTHVQARRIPES